MLGAGLALGSAVFGLWPGDRLAKGSRLGNDLRQNRRWFRRLRPWRDELLGAAHPWAG